MESNIRRTATVNATYRMEQDEPHITANVRFGEDNRLEAVENGIYANEKNPTAATFNLWGDQNLSVQYNVSEGRTAILSDIEAFINGVKES